MKVLHTASDDLILQYHRFISINDIFTTQISFRRRFCFEIILLVFSPKIVISFIHTETDSPDMMLVTFSTIEFRLGHRLG